MPLYLSGPGNWKLFLCSIKTAGKRKWILLMGSASTGVWRKYSSSTELNYITYFHRAICTANTLLLNWVLLLKQSGKKERIEFRMAEKPAWSFQLPAEQQHTPTQPCTAKTGDAEGNQQFSSLRLKVKVNQPSYGSRDTCFQWTPKGRDSPGAARDTQHATTSLAVAWP